VVGIVGALIAGWNSPVRSWLCLALAMFLIIWAITPTIFWPMIHQLYGTATGRVTATDVESVRLAHRWLVCNSLRVSLIAVGFIASVRALSFPAHGQKV
jgi:Anthrone oxygenase